MECDVVSEVVKSPNLGRRDRIQSLHGTIRVLSKKRMDEVKVQFSVFEDFWSHVGEFALDLDEVWHYFDCDEGVRRTVFVDYVKALFSHDLVWLSEPSVIDLVAQRFRGKVFLCREESEKIWDGEIK